MRITVQLIQVRDQTDLWTESYDRELKDILALQDSVARAIADQIHITLTAEEQTRLARPRQLEPAAYEAYLKGRYYWNKRTVEGMQKASIYFQQAIKACCRSWSTPLQTAESEVGDQSVQDPSSPAFP